MTLAGLGIALAQEEALPPCPTCKNWSVSQEPEVGQLGQANSLEKFWSSTYLFSVPDKSPSRVNLVTLLSEKVP
ncbi:hypothetical protein K474DRAFT_1670373 [Panus rudis PR-1116 ss-1]|nr:hypothetical protein K474DRAFT_1670373 [Panus rudis PR-1116 ss-1]